MNMHDDEYILDSILLQQPEIVTQMYRRNHLLAWSESPTPSTIRPRSSGTQGR